MSTTEHTAAPDKRPYRAMSATGPEIDVVGTPLGADRPVRHTLRQVGWLGQTGAFYTLDEEVHPYERGSFSPLYFMAHSDYVVEDEAKTDTLDAAYREHAQLVSLLAALYPSSIGYFDRDAPEWAVVIIETPTGQMSWHISPSDIALFDHVEPSFPGLRGWDGHTTEEKYERLRALVELQAFDNVHSAGAAS